MPTNPETTHLFPTWKHQAPHPNHKTKNHTTAAATTPPIHRSSAPAQIYDDDSASPCQLTTNPYSQYRSRCSRISPHNPYATEAPILCGDDE
jgi:hypothetical protein